MTALRWILLFLCMLGMTGIAPAYAETPATILALRGGGTAEKARLVLELDRPLTFRATVTEVPPRLGIDLTAIPITISTPQGLPTKMGVTRMEQTQVGNRLVLSFILKAPVRIVSAFTLPKDKTKPDRLVIDYAPLGAAPTPPPKAKPPAAAKETAAPKATKDSGPHVLGTLTYPAPKPAAPTPPPKSKFLQQLDLTSAPTAAPVPLPTQKPTAGTPQLAPTTAAPAPEQAPTLPAPSFAPRTHVIIVDAGHGGKDPGAIGVGKLQEKNITLAAAKELKRQLEDTGRFRVVMTRTDDRFILLPDRVKIGRKAKGDLFVSLHADMAADAEFTDGLSIYTLSDTASDAQTEKLAAQENKVDLLAGLDLSHEQEDVANILIDLAMRENMNQSRFFAGKVVAAMSAGGVNLLEKPHRYAGFAVLKAPDVPSVLVEMGFISNPAEARKLQDGAHRRRLMENLTRGITQYFDYIDKNAQM